MSLFRKEAVSHQSERLTGAIVLSQPMSITLCVTILATFASFVFIFLLSAEYSRKETVRGFLMPNKGIIKSFANQGGTVEQLFVKEGDFVKKDQIIAMLVKHQTNSEGVSFSHQLQEQLTSKLALIDEEIYQHQTIHAKEKVNLTNKLSALAEEQFALEQQLALALKKLSLLNTQQQHINTLNLNGFVSTFEKERQQQALLEAEQEKQNISRLLLQQNNLIEQAAFEQTNLPQRYTLSINNLLRQKSDIENQLTQIKNNHLYTVTASHDGTVTGIQVVEGETLSAGQAQTTPILHILPAGSELVAELLLPTRSAGFIARGQTSRLRFDAFPYQRFGFIESEITRIDRALIAPNEVKLPIAFNEPVYRLRARLTQQQMQAYGQHFELKSGMLFEADIMLERRTLIEWLFEPIFSLKGRVG